jgi:TM2 domain-containing membrane protein YozV
MNPIMAAGLAIGVLCGVWMFVMGFTGWYKDPQLLNLFFVVIVIEVGGLIWGLRRTAAQGRTYSGQVVAGTMMAIIAGVVIIVCSLIFTTVAFPNYFEEVNAVGRDVLQAQGKTENEIADAMSASAAWQTPIMNAFAGFLGTFFTGVIASAVIAAWIRQRPDVVVSGV